MDARPWARTPGLTSLSDGGAIARVWAPGEDRVAVRYHGRSVVLGRTDRGWHEGVLEDCAPGTEYWLELGDERLPDPASRWQPKGVHGPSAVVEDRFQWNDRAWRPPRIDQLVFYEIHVGTFSDAGDLDGAAERLAALAELGVTAVEIMPLAQFPGRRNWGYDGVFPWSVQNSYGGPAALRRFVDRAHREGLAVFLDVVYNHLGPEGNVLARFGPYFTDRYATPWGAALNFDGPGSDEVRWFFIGSALRFLRDFHVDGLRLDAVHAIADTSPRTFVEELTAEVHDLGADRARPYYVVAESDADDPRLTTPVAAGGIGCDAQWADGYHHALHALVTGERTGYYEDFGGLMPFVRTLERGFAHAGSFSPSRGRRHGRPLDRTPEPSCLVVCAQNHDQIGNRAAGDRLAASLKSAQLRVVAAAVLLAPWSPLLFMGEEYGERRPFPYFTDHSDPDLVEAVRRGRLEEFPAFSGDVRDPQAPETFAVAILGADAERDRDLEDWYRALLQHRRAHPLRTPGPVQIVEARTHAPLVAFRRGTDDTAPLVVLSFADVGTTFVPPAGTQWRIELDSIASGGGRVRDGVVIPEAASMDVAPWSARVLVPVT